MFWKVRVGYLFNFVFLPCLSSFCVLYVMMLTAFLYCSFLIGNSVSSRFYIQLWCFVVFLFVFVFYLDGWGSIQNLKDVLYHLNKTG